MTTMTSLHRGHDVNYFNAGHSGGCTGAMSYYAKAGEPPGQWHGRTATQLGLSGTVNPQVIENLFMRNISPAGEQLARRPAVEQGERAVARAVREYRQQHPDASQAEIGRAADRARAAGHASDRTVARRVAEYKSKHPFASVTEIEEARAKAKAEPAAKQIPYFDLTISAVKSVSVLHASYRVGAMQARARGEQDLAARLDRRADQIEQALMDAARDAVDWLQAEACYTRTGYHTETTGQWRDGRGLAAGLYLHHLSRDGDPQLHVHAAIWNHTQVADLADTKYRTLFGRALMRSKLGVAPVADRFMEARLRGQGFVMVPRADGNGCEVGGIPERVMARFSSRGVAVAGHLAELAAEFERVHKHPPSQRTLWLLHQQAGKATRRSKTESRRTVGGLVGARELTDAERMEAWEKQTADEEMAALSWLWQAAEQYAADHAPAGPGEHGALLERAPAAPAPAPEGAPAVQDLPPVPGRVLADADKRRAARVAVAEAQKRHSAWSLSHLRFEIHRALGPGVTAADITEIAALVTSGRSGCQVVQVGDAPDVADVGELGVRASDGISEYRPPCNARWATLGHLDLEEHIARWAAAPVEQLVSEADARAAVAATDLTPQQAEAVVAMLTQQVMTVPLNAAAGSGKSHTMAVFASLHTALTGRRVIGLTASTNAAEVLAGEGVPETYNIAQFTGKIKDSAELRWPVQVHAGDVLIIDEATQVSTADVALVQQAARSAGARMNLVGDTHQLGSVDAGGMFHQLVADMGGPVMEEILRFDHEWEQAASVRLRAADLGVLADYERRARIRPGDHETVFAQAAGAWLGDHLRGKDTLLLAGSNAEAADLSRRVQAQLARLGRVGLPDVELGDGNLAGTGDLIRARLNTHIDAGGRRLTNRDTLQVTAVGEETVTAQRKVAGAWSAPFPIPRAYLAESAELDYAGNVHVAEGRTADTCHPVITPTMSRQGFYVAMTRGREANTAHVQTGATAPKGKQPYEQATPAQVIAGVLDRDAGELSATEQLRGDPHAAGAGQEWASSAGHVMHLWSVTVRRDLHPLIDGQVTAALTADQARRYHADFAREALYARLREAQLAGHDLGDLVGRITAEDLGGARSVAAVLHSRLEGIGLDDQHEATWAQRTPAGASPLAGELAEALDARTRELGVRAADKPQPWAAARLGVGALAADASPALRADWERRAGIAAAYREAAGITDPYQDIAADPHEGNPELETARKAAMRALQIPDDAQRLRAMTGGQLESEVARAQRAVAAAPPDVSADLRAAALGQADSWAQAAQARAAADHAVAEGAENLARIHAARQDELEQQQAAYEKWSATTAGEREAGGRARAELVRRGDPAPDGGQGDGRSLGQWWQQFEQDVAEVDKALAAERQAALDEGRPWPPARPQPEPSSVKGNAVRSTPDPKLEPEPEDPGPDSAEPDTRTTTNTSARVEALNARLDALTEQARQISADRAEAETASQDHARAQREATLAAEADADAAPGGPVAAPAGDMEPG